MSATNEHERTDTFARLLLAAALAIGALRWLRLGEWSLWIDEAFTLGDALSGREFENPLGYFVWRQWLAVVGSVPTEAELRAPAALFGHVGVLLVWFAARPFVGARAAALAALLLALSPWHVYWSQSARFYTLASALSLAGVALAAPPGARPLRRASGFLLAGAALLAHPSAGLVLPGLVAGPLIARARPGAARGGQRVLAWTALGVGAVLAAVWALPILRDWNVVKGGANPAHLVLSSGFFLTPALAVLAAFGLFDVFKRRDHPGAVLALLVVFGWLGAFAVSLVMRVSAQYVFVLLPYTLALAAAPFARGASGSPARLAGFSAALAALLAAAPLATNTLLQLTVRNGEREHWREAYAVVARERRDGDLVLGMAAPVGQYYLAPGSRDLREPTALEYLDRFRFEAATFAAHVGRRTWFVVNEERFAEWPSEQRDELRRILREDCRLVAHFPLEVESRDLSVFVYLRE
jgi:hypothetical protein